MNIINLKGVSTEPPEPAPGYGPGHNRGIVRDILIGGTELIGLVSFLFVTTIYMLLYTGGSSFEQHITIKQKCGSHRCEYLHHSYLGLHTSSPQYRHLSAVEAACRTMEEC